MSERTNGQEMFRSLLLTVVGQAYQAAGYTLAETPMQWAGGRYRFSQQLNENLTATIEYQVLIYTNTEYAARTPSRFRVTLIRTNSSGQTIAPEKVQSRTLSALVVEDFGVAILPSADYWWTYENPTALGQALAEAGHLVVGYGIPWLSGTLLPPTP